MLSSKEINHVFNVLGKLGLDYRFGYAGSYARGQAEENSDLDIVVVGGHSMSGDDYMKLYHVLKQLLTVKFDIVDLAALKEDDEKIYSYEGQEIPKQDLELIRRILETGEYNE